MFVLTITNMSTEQNMQLISSKYNVVGTFTRWDCAQRWTKYLCNYWLIMLTSLRTQTEAFVGKQAPHVSRKFIVQNRTTLMHIACLSW